MADEQSGDLKSGHAMRNGIVAAVWLLLIAFGITGWLGAHGFDLGRALRTAGDDTAAQLASAPANHLQELRENSAPLNRTPPSGAAAPGPVVPTFDIVRVEPDGTTVVAGRAAPQAEVAVLSNGERIGAATADARGEWALVVENPLAPGDHNVTLSAKSGERDTRSDQSIAIALAESADQKPLIVLSEKGAASKILQAPEPAPVRTAARDTMGDAPQTGTRQPKAPQTDAAPSGQSLATTGPSAGAAGTGRDAAADGQGGTAARPRSETSVAAASADGGEPGAATPGDSASPTAGAEGAQPERSQDATAAPGRLAARSTGEPTAEPAGATPSQQAGDTLALSTVDYDDQGNMIFAGRAAPDSAVRLYVDNKPVADARADGDGNWQVAVRKAIDPGNHILRVDELGLGSGVSRRVELPFTRADPQRVIAALGAERSVTVEAPAKGSEPTSASPTSEPASPPPPDQPGEARDVAAPGRTQVAAASPESQQQAEEGATPASGQPSGDAGQAPTARDTGDGAAPAPAAGADPAADDQAADEPAAGDPAAASASAEAGTVVVQGNGRVVIQPGNNLWNIARVLYGSGVSYTTIYQANRGQIRNPDLIYPGQVFDTPGVNPPIRIPPRRREPYAAQGESG